MHKTFYVYILTNKTNGTLYTGITNNLVRRSFEHKNQATKSFTSKYWLQKLVYYEIYEEANTAIAREKHLKKAYRKTKIKLIEEKNPDWLDLWDSII